MSDFFNDYFNFKKMFEEKKEYKQQMARVEAMPDDYRYVFKRIQSYMWSFTSGAGYDMLKVHGDLTDLFESSIENGKSVLDITGEDVAGFCEALLESCRTYTGEMKDKFNREIYEKLRTR